MEGHLRKLFLRGKEKGVEPASHAGKWEIKEKEVQGNFKCKDGKQRKRKENPRNYEKKVIGGV
jgi:hypothetical protein